MSRTVSKSAGPAIKRFILLDRAQNAVTRLARENTFRVRRVSELEEAFRHSSQDSLWIVVRSPLGGTALGGGVHASFHAGSERLALGDLLHA